MCAHKGRERETQDRGKGAQEGAKWAARRRPHTTTSSRQVINSINSYSQLCWLIDIQGGSRELRSCLLQGTTSRTTSKKKQSHAHYNITRKPTVMHITHQATPRGAECSCRAYSNYMGDDDDGRCAPVPTRRQHTPTGGANSRKEHQLPG